MTTRDLLKYLKDNPNKTISEIARANRSTFYEIQKAMSQLEDEGIVTSLLTNGSSANQRVVWRVNGNK